MCFSHLTPCSCLCWWILTQYCNEPWANVSHVGPKLSLSAQVQISSVLNQAQIRLCYHPKSSCSLYVRIGPHGRKFTNGKCLHKSNAGVESDLRWGHLWPEIDTCLARVEKLRVKGRESPLPLDELPNIQIDLSNNKVQLTQYSPTKTWTLRQIFSLYLYGVFEITFEGCPQSWGCQAFFENPGFETPTSRGFFVSVAAPFLGLFSNLEPRSLEHF